ncbi:MAG: hypothetical protein KME04_00235 [Pleurocapsa minor GSE-CHR-MK-17-07R]|jgi:hypothetical protein|nr:hypothetical protein [Pleurocapsa minor GSE-CHR-MK 17-07R]
MAALVFLIEQWATGLYIIFGALFVLQLWRLRAARMSLRATQFELERSLGRFRLANTATYSILLLEAILVVVGVQQIVAPTVRAQLGDTIGTVLITASDGDFRTPTPVPPSGQFVIDSSGVQLGEVNPANQIQPTPTLTPTFVGTIIPNSPAVVGCDTPNAQLQVPANGMIVFEPIIVRGTAFTDDFAFYKFELNGPATFGNFAPLAIDGAQPVIEVGELGQFVPAFYSTGEYRFRVVVFDVNNVARASCELTIYIQDPIPTPTPLGTAAGS